MTGQENYFVHNVVVFGRVLRGLGLPVGTAQIADVITALTYVDLSSREDVKHTLRALLVRRREDRPLFDEAFDLFWKLVQGGPLAEVDLSRLLQRPPRQQMALVRWLSEEGEGGEPPEEVHEDRVYTFSAREVLRTRDFAELSPDELEEVRRLMQGLSWALPQRRTRRRVPAARGSYFDLRRTFRRNMRYGAEPVHLVRRRPKYRRRPLVAICDISGSMERYSRVLLQFLYAITNRLDRVETFVFGTRLTRITRQLQRRDIDEALAEATRHIVDWGGGTRIGEALKTFNYRWARRVLGGGAVVLIISDGWDRGDVDLLEREMARLHRSCYRLIWLNPLLGMPGYEPLTRGMQTALPHVDAFLPVHNLESLEQLGDVLARLNVL